MITITRLRNLQMPSTSQTLSNVPRDDRHLVDMQKDPPWKLHATTGDLLLYGSFWGGGSLDRAGDWASSVYLFQVTVLVISIRGSAAARSSVEIVKV